MKNEFKQIIIPTGKNVYLISQKDDYARGITYQLIVHTKDKDGNDQKPDIILPSKQCYNAIERIIPITQYTPTVFIEDKEYYLISQTINYIKKTVQYEVVSKKDILGNDQKPIFAPRSHQCLNSIFVDEICALKPIYGYKYTDSFKKKVYGVLRYEKKVITSILGFRKNISGTEQLAVTFTKPHFFSECCTNFCLLDLN